MLKFVSVGCFLRVVQFPPPIKLTVMIYCEITFIRGVPIFVVFVGRPIYENKNPTNMELGKQLDINIQWNLCDPTSEFSDIL